MTDRSNDRAEQNRRHLQPEQVLKLLEVRFNENPHRHRSVKWSSVLRKIKADQSRLRSLLAMEVTGGEPDVVGYDPNTGEFIFCDCSPESPEGRRSLCFDDEAWNARLQDKPRGSAQQMATNMGISILLEEEYKSLQALGLFDRRTSSWIATPEDIRKRGGALFGHRRFNRVFVFHNGAESYYAARGFRGLLRV